MIVLKLNVWKWSHSPPIKKFGQTANRLFVQIFLFDILVKYCVANVRQSLVKLPNKRENNRCEKRFIQKNIETERIFLLSVKKLYFCRSPPVF